MLLLCVCSLGTTFSAFAGLSFHHCDFYFSETAQGLRGCVSAPSGLPAVTGFDEFALMGSLSFWLFEFSLKMEFFSLFFSVLFQSFPWVLEEEYKNAFTSPFLIGHILGTFKGPVVTAELAVVFKSSALLSGLLAFSPGSDRASPAPVACCHTWDVWMTTRMMGMPTP